MNVNHGKENMVSKQSDSFLDMSINNNHRYNVMTTKIGQNTHWIHQSKKKHHWFSRNYDAPIFCGELFFELTDLH